MSSAVVPEVDVAQLVTLKYVDFKPMLNRSQIYSVHNAVITFVREAISRFAFYLNPKSMQNYRIGTIPHSTAKI